MPKEIKEEYIVIPVRMKQSNFQAFMDAHEQGSYVPVHGISMREDGESEEYQGQTFVILVNHSEETREAARAMGFTPR